jgi:hypothetical protein
VLRLNPSLLTKASGTLETIFDPGEMLMAKRSSEKNWLKLERRPTRINVSG